MKFKNKGRKIYKTKEKNYYGKSTAGKILSAALSLLLLGGIGFLGYSVAEPIINYSKKRGDSDAVITETTDASQVTSFDITDNASEVMNPSEASAEQLMIKSLTTADLTDSESLREALAGMADSGIEFVSVPLKVGRGEIYYSSRVTEAQLCGAVKSQLTLYEISKAIRDSGLKPAAEINILHDNIIAKTYPDTGYKIESDGSCWLDNDSENGGEPWISPFSDEALTYVYSIADEVAAADFEKVICSDIVFPPFREKDIELIGAELRSSDGYTALTSIANTLYSKITNGGESMMLEVSADDIIRGNDDVIQPMLLNVNTLVLKIDLLELEKGIDSGSMVYEFNGTPEQNAVKALELTEEKLSDYNVVVRIAGDGKSLDSLKKVKDVISDLGYNSFIIG